MKLLEYKNTYEARSKTLSDINRQIAFAGIALIWIFKKTEQSGDFILCHELVLPAFILILGLGLDMLQYIYQSIAWYCFFRKQEKINNNNLETEVLAPLWMSSISWGIFGLKIVAIIVAYIFISTYLYNILT